MTRQVRLAGRKGTEQALILKEGMQVIGRGESCDHVLQAASVSSEHCRIDCSGGMIVLQDLRSTNGTHVNEQSVTRTVLDPGDRVQIGTFHFEVEIATAEPPARRSAPPANSTTAETKNDVPRNHSGSAVSESPGPDREPKTNAEPASPLSASASLATVEQSSPDSAVSDASSTSPSLAPAPTQTAAASIPPKNHQPKVARESRDWSEATEFLRRNAKSVSALAGLGLLAALFLVPWATLSVPSDQELCEFYETTLANVIMMRKTGGSPADWDDFASQAISQNSEYVDHLDVQGLSPSARILLIAGRDYLEKMFTESRRERSSAEQAYHQKVASVRKLIGGQSLVEDYEDPEAIAKRKTDNAAAQEALSEMFGT